MAVRTVSVRLAAETTAYQRSMQQAARSTTQASARMQASMQEASSRASRAVASTAAANRAAATSIAQSSSRAAAATERVATAAGQVPAAFRAASAGAVSSLARVNAAAATSSAAMAGMQSEMSAATAAAAASASRAAAASAAVTAQAGATAAASTRRIVVAAGQVPPAFRAASTAAVSSLGSVSAAATASSVAVSRLQTGMTAATAAAAAGTSQLNLANRLAMAQAARASQSAMASASAFGRMRDRARDMGTAVTSAATRSTAALRATRTASIGLLAAFGVAVYAAAKFDKAMSDVGAVASASADQMADLRAAALEAGRTTSYSASQAAQAEEELAKAGVSVADITGGALKGSLNLAAAAQIDLAEATEISANTMTVFGLKGKDVGHVADVLAAAANKSTTDVHQLGMSLRQSGQVASQTGLSLEDTAGALALFAAEGLKGSDAGTSLKVMLQRLTPQSKEAQKTMDKLGFSAYDSQGQFVGLEEMSRRLKKSFSGLTPEARNAAMGVIFGSDAVRGAMILYKHGAAGVREYTNAVDDNGYAAAVAAKKMDNLVGDLQYLKSALETALIQSGSAANGALRDMAQWVTRLVNAYNNLPPGVQQAVTVMTGFVGALGLAATGVLLLLPRIMTVRRELVALGLTATRVRGALMMLGRLGLVVAMLAAVNYTTDKLMSTFDDAPTSISKLKNSLLDFAKTGKATGEASKVLGKDLNDFGDAVKMVAHPTAWQRIKNGMETIRKFGGDSEQLEEATQKLKDVDDALAGLVNSGATDQAAEAFKLLAKEANDSGTSTKKLRTLLPQYTDALADSDTQSRANAKSQGSLEDALARTKDEMQDQRTQAEKLADALKDLNGNAINAADAQISFESSLHDLTQAAKENGHSLDVNSEKGRAVKSAFLDAARAAQEHAQKVAEQKNSVAAGNQVLAQNIVELRRTMKQAGFTDTAIDKLIGSYAQMPAKKWTHIAAPGAVKTANQLQTIKDKIHTTHDKTVTVNALTAQGQRHLEALGFKIKRTKGKKVVITAPTGDARYNVGLLKDSIAGIDRFITIRTLFVYDQSKASFGSIPSKFRPHADGGLITGYAAGGAVRGFPGGGQVSGPGTGTSDSIPSLLSDGEYVIRAAMVRRYGASFFDLLNSGQLPLVRSWDRGASQTFERGGQDIGREVVDGMTSTLPSIQAAASRMGKSIVASLKAVEPTVMRKPATSFDRAVGELNRLVDSGRWRKEGSRLFEDISFQGMSSNFEKNQRRVADGFWAAVQEIQRAVAAGKPVFEDMTFQGMSSNVKRFHDAIAQIWKGNPYGRNFGDWGNFGEYGRYGKYAAGGLLRGPGGPTSDSLIIRASRDEYVMRAAAVRRYGVPMMDALNSMEYPAGGAQVVSARRYAGSGGSEAAMERAMMRIISRIEGTGTTYNVYPRKSVIDREDLRLLQRQDAAYQRVGRPR